VSITRRELLRALGTSAAAGALWSVGCGPPAKAASLQRFGPEELRAALREAVARVRTKYPYATGWAALRERTTLLAGSGERGTARRSTATVVLRARDASGRTVERVVGEADPGAIAVAAAELATAGPGGGGALAPGAAEDHAEVMATDLANTPRARWLDTLDATLARAEALSSSRIVWQSAHATIDDDRRWFVGDGRDVAQRAVRVRSGVTLMAWSGTRPMIGEVMAARAGGLEALALDDDEVDRAARRALELLTPGDLPAGASAVVLDSSVVAAAITAGVGGVLTTAWWTRPDLRARALAGATIGAAAVTITDDPGAGGFARYVVDDEGWPAAPTPLITAGVLGGVLADEDGAARAGVPRTGHGRRGHGNGGVAARPGQLTLAPGAATDDELLAAIGDGVVVEDADGAVVDPATWRITVRARRVRRVARGKLSGHAWTDVELRAELPQLLADVTAIGATARAYGGFDDDGVAIGATAPAIATRGALSTRRGA